MTNWKKGDIAICVNNGTLPGQDPEDKLQLPALRKNAEYLVNAVRVCECGSVSLDVGLSASIGTNCRCGGISSPVSGVHWCSSYRFVKRNEKSIEEQIEEAIENEDYELAQKLKSDKT